MFDSLGSRVGSDADFRPLFARCTRADALFHPHAPNREQAPSDAPVHDPSSEQITATETVPPPSPPTESPSDAALYALAEAVDRLTVADIPALQHQFQCEVLVIVRAVVGSAVFDTDQLRALCDAAVVQLADAAQRMTLTLHPADAVIMEPLWPHGHITPCPDMPRGTVRIDTPTAGILHGAGPALDALADSWGIA